MKRKIDRRQSTQLMTASERRNLMVLPHMHLHQICTDQLDLEYLHTIAGVFNIAGALANARRRRDLELEIDEAQLIMEDLIATVRLPTEVERAVLKAAFIRADHFITMQRKPDIARAIAYVDRRIQEQSLAKKTSKEAPEAAS